METTTVRKLIRDAVLSLFIYALPVVLMFVSFYLSGKKPWIRPQASITQTKMHNNHP